MPPGIYPRASGSTIAERLDYYSMPEPNSGCRLWIGGMIHTFGYGQLRVGKRNPYAHVLQWRRYNGPIPPGGYVCHKCDVPACVEPTHLFLGTLKINMADKVAKRRHVFGEQSAMAKLSDAVIPVIRLDGRRHEDIARDYGVTKGLIGQVKRGVIWRHVQ